MNPFIHFRKGLADEVEVLSDEEPSPRPNTVASDASLPKEVSVGFDHTSGHAYMLMSDSSKSPALMYSRGDSGFIIAKFKSRSVETEFPNSYLGDDGNIHVKPAIDPTHLKSRARKRPAATAAVRSGSSQQLGALGNR